MARVPTVTGPQVQRSVQPIADQTRVGLPDLVLGDFKLPTPAPLVTPEFKLAGKDPFRQDYNRYKPEPVQYADTKAQGLIAFGNQLGHAAETINTIGMDVKRQTDAMVTDDAVNKAKETAIRLAYDKDSGFTSLKGYNALNRPDGKPLADEFASKFDETVKALSGDLKNDTQRQAFAVQALGIRTSLYNQAIQHESQEHRTYNLSVQDGTIKIETDNVGRNYRDPDSVNTSVERIKGAVAEQGFALGKSATWIEAAQTDAVSKAHSMALTAALEDGNVVFADAYMKAHNKDMNADDVLRVRGVITKEMDGRVGLAAAKDAVAIVAPNMEPTEGDRLLNIVKGLEGGGTLANPKTSPKGARGPMQVMPYTANKPGYGIKASDGTAADDARVGREYLGAMIKLRNGDVALALASYNAGPGRVDDAIKEAAKPENKGKSWFDFVPGETKDYVVSGVKAYGAGGGKPATPTLQDALAALDKDPRVNSSPARLQIARSEVTARFNAMVADRKSSEEDTVAAALRSVEANGGEYLSLPTSLRAALPADKIDTVMNFADKVRSGNQVTNNAVYQKLTDDKYLRSLTPDAFYALRPELSPSDFQHFADLRAKPAAGQGPGDLNTPALKAAVDTRLSELRINPNPSAKDAGSMARVGGINRFVRERLLMAQAQAGKKFNDLETEAFVDQLFAKSISMGGGIFGPDSKRALEMTRGDLSNDTIEAIKGQFAKRGITNPTDADIMGAYWRSRAFAGR